MKSIFALAAIASAVSLNKVGDEEWLTDRYSARILRYDPNIEQEMADQVRDIEKRQWAINRLEHTVATNKWDPKKNWNPDELLVDRDMLKTLKQHHAEEARKAEGELIEGAHEHVAF